jgi:hypothetical protein
MVWKSMPGGNNCHCGKGIKNNGGVIVENQKVQSVKRIGSGLAIILFPIMLLLGFILHPNFFSFGMVTNVADWANEWRGVFLFHFGHLLVLLAVPLIIAAGVRFMSLLKARGAWLGFVGGVLGIFGAFMLAVDKGALTLVLTALQTIPDSQFDAITPALQVLLDRAGWLGITWLYALLIPGFILQALGLMRARMIKKWQGILIIIGLILLANPDIEIISSAAAILLCIGFIPIGIHELKGTLQTS